MFFQQKRTCPKDLFDFILDFSGFPYLEQRDSSFKTSVFTLSLEYKAQTDTLIKNLFLNTKDLYYFYLSLNRKTFVTSDCQISEQKDFYSFFVLANSIIWCLL